MAEHLTDVCKRVSEEAYQNPVAPLGDVPLTVEMRTRIERWYSDRAFLADQVRRIKAKSEKAVPCEMAEVEQLRADNATLLAKCEERTLALHLAIGMAQESILPLPTIYNRWRAALGWDAVKGE